jgi:membrane-associated phospholipid phosphatase
VVPQRRVDLKVVPGYGRGGPRSAAAAPAPRPPRRFFGRHAEPPAEVAGPLDPGLRPSDGLVLLYLAVTLCLMVALHARVAFWALLAVAHAVAGALLLRVAASRPHPSGALRAVRDFYPLLLLPVFYFEYHWLTQLTGVGPHDAAIAALEQRWFGFQPSQQLHRMWPWPWLSQYLHGAYFCYYAVPPMLAFTLYGRGRWRAFQESLTTVMLSFLACGLVFICYPVAGPYHHFGIPDLGPLGGGLAALAHRVVQAGSSVGTAFPSSHAAVAVAVWMSALRLSPRVFRVQALIVPALLVGTVYGGFHYAVDAAAGAAFGVAAGILGPRLHAFLAQRLPRAQRVRPATPGPRAVARRP